jgi:ABC-type uncharacterized transport system ATPase subunit
MPCLVEMAREIHADEHHFMGFSRRMKARSFIKRQANPFPLAERPLAVELVWCISISCWYRFSPWGLRNIMLGARTHTDWCIGYRKSPTKISLNFSSQYGLDIDPTALVHDLPVGIQQRVEIIKALYRKAEILILDEPTAVLTPQEVEDLFVIIRKLVDQGISVIFITHKLKEVLSIADRITVMRGGKVIATDDPAKTNEQALASQMVGRTVFLRFDKNRQNPVNCP